MLPSAPKLDGLRVERQAVLTTIGTPRRWIARYLVPGMIFLGFAGLAGWSAWATIVPGMPVTVSPVVVKQSAVTTGGAELFSATGWIEPGPTPIEVPALVEGVVEQVLVRPGQRVQAGQIVAQLIDVDVRLALRAAEEEQAERQQRVLSAQADVEEAEAQFHATDATFKADEELRRDKLISSVKYEASLALRVVAQARIAQVKARMEEARIRVRQAEVNRAIAQLRLDRTQVRTPTAGVVMSLNAMPGRMLGVRAGTTYAVESVMTLYDPLSLLVRVEVPIDKFQLVQAGQTATLEVDVAQGERLAGVVLYDTHETDVNRNTVRVKVSVLPPLVAWPPLPDLVGLTPLASAGLAFASVREFATASQARLRPGMIAKVRIFASVHAMTDGQATALRLFMSKRFVVKEGNQAMVWIVDPTTLTARFHAITVASSSNGAWVEVTQGLQPSDKLIVSGREQLKAGQRVRIVGEEP